MSWFPRVARALNDFEFAGAPSSPRRGWSFSLGSHGLDQLIGSMRTKPFSFLAQNEKLLHSSGGLSAAADPHPSQSLGCDTRRRFTGFLRMYCSFLTIFFRQGFS